MYLFAGCFCKATAVGGLLRENTVVMVVFKGSGQKGSSSLQLEGKGMEDVENGVGEGALTCSHSSSWSHVSSSPATIARVEMNPTLHLPRTFIGCRGRQLAAFPGV